MSTAQKISLWFSCVFRFMIITVKIWITPENEIGRFYMLNEELDKIEQDLDALI